MILRSRFGRLAAAVAGALGALLVAGGAGAQPPGGGGAPQLLALRAVAPKLACDALPALDVSAAVGAPTVVASASVVDSQQPRAYCAVRVVVDNYARFELHLPLTGWTQRLLFGGGPGAQTAPGIAIDRFATVSWEDLGHRENEDVLANNPAAQVNAGYRGMHLQVLAAKALVARFYGRPQRFAYYNACSNPGREGMIEVERFPRDFDGVGAGCPPINTTVNNGLFTAWNVLTNTGPGGQPILTADKLPILHKAVLDQCDAADGVRDGIVSDPYACHPVLSVVTCRSGEDPAGCLTPAQAHVAAEIYRGPHDAQGHNLLPGGVLPGSELAWTATIVPGDAPYGGPGEARTQTEKAIRSHYSWPALPPSWHLSDLTFDRATFAATTGLNRLHDGTNPDLSGYARAGHKLILWMSLADTNVMPHQAVLYWRALQAQMGTRAVAGFARFYVLPGVYHCGGGDGPVISNLLGPLMAWVERGIAPHALAGAHRPGGFGGRPPAPGAVPPVPDLTRPIYPYPHIARYIGHGDIRDGANYVEGPARPAPAALGDWPGARFYTPAAMKWCTASATAISCTAKP